MLGYVFKEKGYQQTEFGLSRVNFLLKTVLNRKSK